MIPKLTYAPHHFTCTLQLFSPLWNPVCKTLKASTMYRKLTPKVTLCLGRCSCRLLCTYSTLTTTTTTTTTTITTTTMCKLHPLVTTLTLLIPLSLLTTLYVSTTPKIGQTHYHCLVFRWSLTCALLTTTHHSHLPGFLPSFCNLLLTSIVWRQHSWSWSSITTSPLFLSIQI